MDTGAIETGAALADLLPPWAWPAPDGPASTTSAGGPANPRDPGRGIHLVGPMSVVLDRSVSGRGPDGPR
ncbi:MAG: hypothetical protein ACQSGP_09105, partial [Frankia sp.]